MKITILAAGSEGDVRPLLALGCGLKEEGYEVLIATHETFRKSVVELGMEFALIRANPRAIIESEAGQAALKKGRYQDFIRATKPVMLEALADCWTACEGTGAVLHSPFGWYAGPHICERLGVPGFSAQFQPFDPTRLFPSFLSPTQRSLGAILNRFTYALADAIFWVPYRSLINQWRREQLDLPPLGLRYHHKLRKQGYRTLYAFSPHVVSKPPDWGRHITVTGYWFIDSGIDWQPPSGLADFLSAGSHPVYMGFGSMSNEKPEEMTDIVLKALASAKQRCVLATGWGGLREADLPSNVISVDWLPHSWLFPRMAAVVHHGGAGTTGAVLRAGVPSVVVPHFADQPFWGQRVADLGVGPEPVPRSQLTVERLATAIKVAVSDERIRRQATVLGEHIRSENGIANAVQVINQHVSSGRQG